MFCRNMIKSSANPNTFRVWRSWSSPPVPGISTPWRVSVVLMRERKLCITKRYRMGDSGPPCDTPFVGLNAPPMCELTLTLYSLFLYRISTIRLKSS